MMEPEGNAIVYCEGAFDSPNGKTAHGLVRFTQRYRILAVIDSQLTGNDARELLDGKPNGIPILADVDSAIQQYQDTHTPATHLVIGLAPDGGKLPAEARQAIKRAIQSGLNIDSGLHDFLSEDQEFKALARENKVQLRDIRKPPHRDDLHFFSGKIADVKAAVIALLGTDSAIGKRTTAWMLVQILREKEIRAELVGTGQTAWLQGAKYSMVLDSLVNDFVAGEIEHAVYQAWIEGGAEVIVIEGQGSLLNPAYPGGFEILAAGRPDGIILQHAPARNEYDGFPGYPLHPLDHQLKALDIISGKPVIAIAINHEGLLKTDIERYQHEITYQTGLPAVDVLLQGGDVLYQVIERWLHTTLQQKHANKS